MTNDIYQLVIARGMHTATYCLAHLNDEQELEECHKSHEAIKGQFIVQLNWV